MDRRVAELAGRQWGVVSRAQLRAAGVGVAAIEHRLRGGRLHRIHRGVYAVGHPVLGRGGRPLAAVLACGVGAALSHRSAAAWWGLLPSAASRVDVSSHSGRHRLPGVRHHRCRTLDARDCTEHEGMPLTTVARTLLDLSAVVRADRLERAVAQAERLRLYDHRAVLDVLARADGHRGARALAAATSRPAAWTRNALEARFLELTWALGLPEPRVNAVIDVPDHGPCEVDFHWPTRRLVVETDGFETHGTRTAFRDDRRRDAALQAAGWRVVRFAWDDVTDEPATVSRRLAAALRYAAPSSARKACSSASSIE